MPSSLHEGLIEIFRCRPSLVTELLAGPLETPVPAYDHVRVDSSDLPDLTPTEYRADVVVTLATDAGVAVLAVVVEVQLRKDLHKRRTWPVYLATLRARLLCPAVLLVVSPDAATAAWCAEPIDLGHPGWILRPLVLAPSRIPVITDVGQARRTPELVVLSAMAHGAEQRYRKVLDAVVHAFDSVDFDHATQYSDLVFGALPAAARRYVEDLMATGTYEVQSEFLRRWRDKGLSEGRTQGLAEGRAQGESSALLTLLVARGFEVSDATRRHITQCTDIEQLDDWIRCAATADSIGELFTE